MQVQNTLMLYFLINKINDISKFPLLNNKKVENKFLENNSNVILNKIHILFLFLRKNIFLYNFLFLLRKLVFQLVVVLLLIHYFLFHYLKYIYYFFVEDFLLLIIFLFIELECVWVKSWQIKFSKNGQIMI